VRDRRDEVLAIVEEEKDASMAEHLDQSGVCWYTGSF
jgi:hypothetical protein